MSRDRGGKEKRDRSGKSREVVDKPVTLLFADPTGIDFEKDSYDYILLDIPVSFLDTLAAGPDLHRDGNTWGYVFGPLYDLDEYDHPGCCEIDNGFVSLCLLADVKKAHTKGRETRDYEKMHGPTRDTPDYLKRVRKDYPEIQWLGRCPSGSRYGHLHYHVDPTRDEVDSIVIDLDYFYDGEIDSHPEDDDLTSSLETEDSLDPEVEKRNILKQRFEQTILREPSEDLPREISTYEIISASSSDDSLDNTNGKAHGKVHGNAQGNGQGKSNQKKPSGRSSTPPRSRKSTPNPLKPSLKSGRKG